MAREGGRRQAITLVLCCCFSVCCVVFAVSGFLLSLAAGDALVFACLLLCGVCWVGWACSSNRVSPPSAVRLCKLGATFRPGVVLSPKEVRHKIDDQKEQPYTMEIADLKARCKGRRFLRGRISWPEDGRGGWFFRLDTFLPAHPSCTLLASFCTGEAFLVLGFSSSTGLAELGLICLVQAKEVRWAVC